MNLILRSRLIAAGSAVVALWLGWQVGHGEFGLPLLVCSLLLCATLVWLLRVRLDVIALGLLLIGYLVGNRGFAQIMPVPTLPLLPAEIVLMLAGSWLLVQCAQTRTLPIRRDALNLVALVWLVLGTARVVFDVPVFGLMALRDYAMIYYALFFFLAQHLAAETRARRFLLGALLVGSVLQPLAVALVENFPAFFLTNLVLHGVPLIYYKGDLAATFMGLSAIMLMSAATGPRRYWAWPLATLEFIYVLTGENRASMVSAIVGLGWLAVSRARTFVLIQVLALALALVSVVGLATLGNNAWAGKKLDGVADRMASLGDVVGRRNYASEESSMKGDNNRFRLVWWRTVAEDVLAQNPVFGLGFGYDLARSFLQEYDPDIADDFTARSPHSIVMSSLGRLGLAGLVAFAAIFLVLAVRTWRIMRDPAADLVRLGLWASVWVILVSACFGVVLEGPMGAVVFWSLLGLANAPDPAAPEEEIASVAEAPALPSPAASASG